MNTGVKTIMLMSIAVPVVAWAQPVARDADTRAVEAVLSRYKNAIEKLDVAGTENCLRLTRGSSRQEALKEPTPPTSPIILVPSCGSSNRSASPTTRSTSASKGRLPLRPRPTVTESSQEPARPPKDSASPQAC